MYFIYIIKHTITKNIYIGITQNLKRRLEEHNKNYQKATSRKEGEWKLIYAEIYRSKKDALLREKKLKQHGSTKRFLLHRIKNSLLES